MKAIWEFVITDEDVEVWPAARALAGWQEVYDVEVNLPTGEMVVLTAVTGESTFERVQEFTDITCVTPWRVTVGEDADAEVTA